MPSFDFQGSIQVLFDMNILAKTALVTGLFSLTAMINLPFGYLRGNAKKFSLRWFLYIHMPIPLIVLVRLSSHLDYPYIPIFLIAAVIGQYAGGKLHF